MVIWYYPDCFRRSTAGWFVTADGRWWASESSMRRAFPIGTVFVMNLGSKPTFKAQREAAAAA